MTKKTKKAAISLALSLLMLALCACQSTPNVNSGKKDEVKVDTFTPATLDGVAEDIEKYNKYKNNYESAFSTLSHNPASDFEYTVSESGVTVNAYKGESDMVVIPEQIEGAAVTGISEKAFFESNIRSIYIPDSVKSIGKSAFSECNSLELIRLPFVGDGGENDHVGYIFGADTYETNALNTPVSVEMIIIGDGCTDIADRAFYGMKSIDAVALEGVSEIGEFAFYGCSELIYIYIPDTLLSIGNYAFGECIAMPKIVIPDNTQSIGFGALYSCRALCDITLSVIGDGESKTHIGYVFGAEYAEWNENFVPGRLRIVTLGESCKRIEGRAFANCDKIVQVNFPESLEFIGVRAFYKCRSLGKIITGEHLEVISGDAFFGCDNMTEAIISKNTVIEKQAFFGCDKVDMTNASADE